MDELNETLVVPQLDVDNTEYKDESYSPRDYWRAQSRLLAMSADVFTELNYSGYIIINKADFTVKFQKHASRRIIRLAFTKGSLNNEVGDDYLLERVKDALSYGYAQLPDESKVHIGFLNVLYGEVFDENGEIVDIGLTINLVVAGYQSNEEHDDDLFVITSTLLGAVSALLESVQNATDEKEK